MPDKRRILIVGGGIGGLTLAAALRQRGFAPRVLERAPVWAPVGAGITLAINAMNILRQIGASEAAEARGTPLPLLKLLDSRGGHLGTTDLSELCRQFGNSIAIHRAALHEVLLSAAGEDCVQLGTVLAGLTDRGHRIAVTLSDGSQEEYDLVVGADGIRSQVRSLAFGPVEPRYSGYTCWRFVMPQTLEIPFTAEMWGRGKRFGVVPLGRGKVYCFATLNAPPGQPDDAPGRVDRFRRRFVEFGWVVPDILKQLNESTPLIHNDLEEIILDRWVKGRIALLGDAAHAMTPNLGMGAAMAMEDAIVLAQSIERFTDLSHALSDYETRRRKRVLPIQTRARKLGEIGQWEHPLACLLRDTLFRLTPDRIPLAGLRRLVTKPQ